MSNSICRIAILLTAAVLATACGGGGGGANGGPSYSISVSPSSVALNGVRGATPADQAVVVTFRGDGVVIGTLPGQTIPAWLSVSAPSQSTSPVTVHISAASSTQPGNYSTTLRFATGKTDGSNVVYKDVPVALQMVDGSNILIDPDGVAQNSSVAVSLNNGAPQTVVHGQINSLGVYAMGSTYTISVPTQPPGQTCTFPEGSSTTTGILSSNFLELRLTCNASLVPWTWVGGSQGTGQAAVYGTRLTPAAANTPGAREPGAYARDAAGNLWLFGGGDTPLASNARNDLWRYNVATGLWTWMSGSNGLNALGIYGTLGQAASGNAPGARTSAVAWFDANGNFWLFGGWGLGASASSGGLLNDLWMYSVAADMWTWMGGGQENELGSLGTYGTTPSVSNIPGGRTEATVVTDAAGAIWFFGGYGLGAVNSFGTMNDLWKFDPATGIWAWMSGSNQPGATAVQGALGVPDPANHPGPREGASGWADGAGQIWVFGGTTPANNGYVNDLWRFDPTTQLWTWVSGTDPTGGFVAAGLYNAPGTTQSNVPSGRAFAMAWTDASGNLWLFGGQAITEDVIMGAAPTNDLWKYTPSTNTWFWMSGSNAASSPAVFGTQGVASNTNVPSARQLAATWTDASGKLWLWGGANTSGSLGDVWSVVPQ